MRVLLLIVAAILAVPAAEAQAGARPVEGATWRWDLKPNATEAGLVVGEHMSASAKFGAIGVVLCEIGPRLRPVGCSTVEETPKSRMGRVASELAELYKAAPTDSAGRPTVGRKVIFTFALGQKSF